jgi:hypothetical protein
MFINISLLIIIMLVVVHSISANSQHKTDTSFCDDNLKSDTILATHRNQSFNSLIKVYQNQIHFPSDVNTKSTCEMDILKFQNWLYTFMNPVSCHDKKFHILTKSGTWGIGAELHGLVHRFLDNLLNGYITVAEYSIHYAKGCKDPTYGCFFEPITNCRVSNITNTESNNIVRSSGVDGYDPSKSYNLRLKRDTNIQSLGLSRPPSEKWIFKEVLRYIMRHNSDMISFINKLKNDMQWNDDAVQNMISIHIRHGDAVDFGLVQHPLSNYILALERTMLTHNKHIVFVTSDDIQVYKTLPISLKTNHRLITNGIQPHIIHVPLSLIHDHHRRDASREVNELEGFMLLGTVYLMGLSKTLIHTTTSYYGRLIHEIMSWSCDHIDIIDMDGDIWFANWPAPSMWPHYRGCSK